MKPSDKLSNAIVHFIRGNLDKKDEELEIIEYGIKVLIINILKLIILFALAFYLKIVPYTLAALISFGILRSFASGVHAESSLLCNLINMAVFFGNVYISIRVNLNLAALVGIYLISVVSIVLYAPADTAERPLISKRVRKISKIKAIIVSIVFCLISIFLANPIYKNIIAFSTLEEALFITPLAYRLFNKSYRNYEKIEI